MSIWPVWPVQPVHLTRCNPGTKSWSERVKFRTLMEGLTCVIFAARIATAGLWYRGSRRFSRLLLVAAFVLSKADIELRPRHMFWPFSTWHTGLDFAFDKYRVLTWFWFIETGKNSRSLWRSQRLRRPNFRTEMVKRNHMTERGITWHRASTFWTSMGGLI